MLTHSEEAAEPEAHTRPVCHFPEAVTPTRRLNIRNLFSHNPGGQKSETKVLARWFLQTPLSSVHVEKHSQDFPGGPVVKNPSTNAEDMGAIPGWGRPHIPWDN